jgi:alanine-synthesizing transaminase
MDFMFSSRFPWRAEPNALSRSLTEMQAAGAAVIDLTESNPTRAGFSYRWDEIAAALGDPRSAVYEPSPAGLLEARRQVAAYYAARGAAVDPADIFLTASTSEAYSYLFKLLCDPGDEILVPAPSYPLFEHLAGLEAVRTVTYPLPFDHGWLLDVEEIRARLTPRSRAVVVVNPNNPTGAYLKAAEWRELSALCQRHGLAAISDEVFSDFAFEPDPQRQTTLAATEGPLVFVLSGLSKVAGLPQLKLGWIAVAGAHDVRRQAAARLEWIADTFLSVAAPAQWALPRLLTLGAEVRGQILARTARNLERLRAAATPETRVLPVEGGWYATVQVPRIRPEEDWALGLLARHRVLVQPGFFYDFPAEAFLIISLLPPPELFDEGARRLRMEFLATAGRGPE